MLGSPAFMTALWITTAKPAKTKEPAAAGQDGDRLQSAPPGPSGDGPLSFWKEGIR